jgi:C_GCAxxG_C_C family probable redox protein
MLYREKRREECMKDKVLEYYYQGYNCSQCILKAAEQKYRIPISKQSINLCKGISNGFGIGGICSVIVAGIMILGALLDEETLKIARLKLINAFQDKYSCLNCSQIKKNIGLNTCETFIVEAADIIDAIISEYSK